MELDDEKVNYIKKFYTLDTDTICQIAQQPMKYFLYYNNQNHFPSSLI